MTVIVGDCREKMREMAENSVDALGVSAEGGELVLEGDHGGPVAGTVPTIAALHTDPVQDGLTPEVVVAPLLGTQGESVEQVDQLETVGLAVDGPDDGGLAGSAHQVGFQEADAGLADDVVKDGAVVVSEFQGEVTGVVSASALGVDSEASLAVDEPSQPVPESVVNHGQVPSQSTSSLPRWQVLVGDCRDVMASMEPNSIDAICTDPPYGLEFMGKSWDSLAADDPVTKAWATRGRKLADNPERSPDDPGGRHAAKISPSQNPRCRKCGRAVNGRDTAKGFKVCHCEQPDIYRPNTYAVSMQQWHETWAREAFRVLKPGGHLLAFGGTRTSHRMVCAIEDAGFEIRDSIVWMHGQGFPKSLSLRDIGRPELGTALKPSHEPICVARKPLIGTVAATVAAWGTGAINVDACRIGTTKEIPGGTSEVVSKEVFDGGWGPRSTDHSGFNPNIGRWPANTVLSHTPHCRPVGVARVKSGTAVRKNGNGGHGLFPVNIAEGSADATYADPDGYETVQAWSCHESCPVRALDEAVGERKSGGKTGGETRIDGIPSGWGTGKMRQDEHTTYGDSGGVSRFFATFPADDPEADPLAGELRFGYHPKASRSERNAGLEGMPGTTKPWFQNGCHICEQCGRKHPNSATSCQCGGTLTRTTVANPPRANIHPTVKSLSLMRWLVRLVTPPGGTVLDPFAGSGSTGCAAALEGFAFIGIEMSEEYAEITRARIAYWQGKRPTVYQPALALEGAAD